MAMNALHALMSMLKLLAAFAIAASVATPAVAQNRPPQESDAPFAAVGRWFSGSFALIGARFKSASDEVDNFNREAAIAARTTGGAVREAAGAIARLPNTRVLSGHQKCIVAANGAPDCTEAANRLCQAKGYAAGQSVDITAAEECPAQVMLGRREAKPGECRNVTFVSKAMCQ
jgi:hypothetical protein